MTQNGASWTWTAIMILASGAPAVGQTGFLPLGQLPGGTSTLSSQAFGVSTDGRWVVGETASASAGSFTEPFRWSAATGMQSLGPVNGSFVGVAYAVSAHGNVVVGGTPTASGGGPFRWTPSTGRHLLFGSASGRATAISHDGSVIAGRLGSASPQGAFVWTDGTGPIVLSGSSAAHAVSSDGSTILGFAAAPLPTGSYYRIFIWNWATSPPVLIDGPPGHEQDDVFAVVASPTGRIVGGWAGGRYVPHRGFVWSAEHGYNLLPNPAGIGNCRVRGISEDGRVIAGHCQGPGPGGQDRAAIWIGTGVAGTYTAYPLMDYLALRGVPVPPNTNLIAANHISADGRVVVGYGTIFTWGISAFRLEFCYANCDQSSTAPYLNVEDFTCFINRFAEALSLPHDQQLYHYANCDHSTVPPVLNVEDFTCFINRFAAGCATP
jgi:uncharacterized membrane protein